jgi:hypothetical protein
VLGSEAGEQFAEPLEFAGLVGQHADPDEEVDRGPIAAVLLRVDLRGGRPLVDRDGVERMGALTIDSTGHPAIDHRWCVLPQPVR